jgi:phosphatidylglycerol:prolipoprotein diacylglycerol transferase
MHPKLFEIPIINWPVSTYGPMLVVGFLAAITLIRLLSRNFKTDPQHITNAALYALIGGVAGARAFYVIHYPEKYQDSVLDVFRIWQGGLELLGGVVIAVAVILIYMIYHKLHIRRYLDILAIGLMAALVFGRIGCFLNGCCFGKPTDSMCAVRFPYDSYPYNSQVNPDLKRNRPEPQLKLPVYYFSYIDDNGHGYLKPFHELSTKQQSEVLEGQYRCLPVHPTQLYSSAGAAFICLLLYLFWRRSQKSTGRFLTSDGSTFSLMLILYGIMRFIIEDLRDDNPFEYGWWAVYKGGTVSQNLAIYMAVLGVVLIVIFQFIKPVNHKS